MHDFSRYQDRWWGFAQVFQTDSFLSDARAVTKIPSEQFTQALTDAAASTGFLDESGLAGTLTSVADAGERNALRNFISAFAAWRSSRSAQRDRSAMLNRIQRELGEALTEHSFSADEQKLIAERVDAIWNRPIPAVDLAIKASRLVTDVGAKIDRITLISDLRPIFDDDRATVLGLVPLTTLKIVSHGEDAVHPNTFEVQLTENELENLHDRVGQARKKIATLKGFVTKVGIPLPRSSMTKKDEGDT